MKNSGYILAVDKSPDKIKILSENLKRPGSKNVGTFISDSSRPGFLDRMEGDYLNYFDAIIVDAPCSALGTAAKNPEAKYNRKFEDIERLSDMALDIMAACDPYLKNGGRMLFYTCTISPVENGQMVRRFLSLMNGRYRIAENIDAAGDPVKMEMEIMPYYLESEAGYLCVLKKKSR
jgi:16S rRNA (cytosine967-C5)-methyltransferase